MKVYKVVLSFAGFNLPIHPNFIFFEYESLV